MQNGINNSGMRVNYLDKAAAEKLAEYIKQFYQEKTLIVCIGTDKCIGDCLGPLVGTFLARNKFPFKVVGTLDSPAHAINLESVVRNINVNYPDYFIIAIDACLGYDDCIGDIQVKMGPVHPGKGVGKNLPRVGDISIVGVVDTIDNSDMFSIRNTRLNFIMNMADVIIDALLLSIKNLNIVRQGSFFETN